MKIENFSNYEIYLEEGKIWSYRKNRFLSDRIDKKGYNKVYLVDDYGNHKEYRMHQWIWIAAHGDIPIGHHIHHIDGDPSNNCISNLIALDADEHNRLHKEKSLS